MAEGREWTLDAARGGRFVKTTKARKAARGQPCLLNVAGVCCDTYPHETTVLVHLRWLGGVKPGTDFSTVREFAVLTVITPSRFSSGDVPALCLKVIAWPTWKFAVLVMPRTANFGSPPDTL